MFKLLALAAMLGYGGYKLHRKAGRWLELLRPLLGPPDRERGGAGAAASRTEEERPGRSLRGARLAADRRAGATGASRLRPWLLLGPFYALALVGLMTLGRWVTQAAVRDGFEAQGDPAATTVARASTELAGAMLDHPVQRFLLPARRVVRVRQEPGHCTDPVPGADPDVQDLVAEVRLYTLFALPYRTVRVTCGGSDGARPVPGSS